MTKYKLNLEEIKESDIPVDHSDVMRWLTEMTLLIPIEEKFPPKTGQNSPTQSSWKCDRPASRSRNNESLTQPVTD